MDAPQIESWRNIVRIGIAILLTGHRRRGKTGLGHKLLEICHEDLDLDCYIVNIPEEKEVYLPWWITNIPFSVDLPENAAIFIDEAALEFYAREHGKKANKDISKVLGAAGQKNQIIIFATHHTRKLDVNVILDMDIWALKKPSKMHVRMERREVKDILKDAWEIFDLLIDPKDKRATVVVDEIRDDYIIAYNDLPSHWCEELSLIFKGVSLNGDVDEEEEKGLQTSLQHGITIHYMAHLKPSIIRLVAELMGIDPDKMLTIDWESDTLERCFHFDISRQKDGLYYIDGRLKPSQLFDRVKQLSDEPLSLLRPHVVIDIEPGYEELLA